MTGRVQPGSITSPLMPKPCVLCTCGRRSAGGTHRLRSRLLRTPTASIWCSTPIDVHLHGRSDDEGLRRAQKYFETGADCVYPIRLSEISAIRDYVAFGPTNVLWRPGGPPLGELARAGVSRISVGLLLFQVMLKRLRVAADALRRLEKEAIWK